MKGMYHDVSTILAKCLGTLKQCITKTNVIFVSHLHPSYSKLIPHLFVSQTFLPPLSYPKLIPDLFRIPNSTQPLFVYYSPTPFVSDIPPPPHSYPKLKPHPFVSQTQTPSLSYPNSSPHPFRIPNSSPTPVQCWMFCRSCPAIILSPVLKLRWVFIIVWLSVDLFCCLLLFLQY